MFEPTLIVFPADQEPIIIYPGHRLIPTFHTHWHYYIFRGWWWSPAKRDYLGDDQLHLVPAHLKTQLLLLGY